MLAVSTDSVKKHCSPTMTSSHNVLWLSVSPYLKCFDRQLLAQLAISVPVRRWEYCQTADEPCCVDEVVAALREHISERANLERSAGRANFQVHLLGHGVSGVVALLYARRYPAQVASLTLLSVDAMPAINWQAHYSAMRHLLPCRRERVLAQMAKLLFGEQSATFSAALVQLLAKDLDSSFTLHSLAGHANIPAGGVEVPLLVCQGQIDLVLGTRQQSSWKPYLKPGDRHWLCPDSRHFFHFHHAAATAKVITEHWAHSVVFSAASRVTETLSPRPCLP